MQMIDYLFFVIQISGVNWSILNLENQSMKSKNPWRWWAKALGEKASKCDKESDRVALIRTVIFATYLITNCFIVAGVIRHWNKQTKIEVFIENPYNLNRIKYTPSNLL
jgi:hypothetical protein